MSFTQVILYNSYQKKKKLYYIKKKKLSLIIRYFVAHEQSETFISDKILDKTFHSASPTPRLPALLSLALAILINFFPFSLLVG